MNINDSIYLDSKLLGTYKGYFVHSYMSLRIVLDTNNWSVISHVLRDSNGSIYSGNGQLMIPALPPENYSQEFGNIKLNDSLYLHNTKLGIYKGYSESLGSISLRVVLNTDDWNPNEPDLYPKNVNERYTSFGELYIKPTPPFIDLGYTLWFDGPQGFWNPETFEINLTNFNGYKLDADTKYHIYLRYESAPSGHKQDPQLYKINDDFVYDDSNNSSKTWKTTARSTASSIPDLAESVWQNVFYTDNGNPYPGKWYFYHGATPSNETGVAPPDSGGSLYYEGSSGANGRIDYLLSPERAVGYNDTNVTLTGWGHGKEMGKLSVGIYAALSANNLNYGDLGYTKWFSGGQGTGQVETQIHLTNFKGYNIRGKRYHIYLRYESAQNGWKQDPQLYKIDTNEVYNDRDDSSKTWKTTVRSTASTIPDLASSVWQNVVYTSGYPYPGKWYFYQGITPSGKNYGETGVAPPSLGGSLYYEGSTYSGSGDPNRVDYLLSPERTAGPSDSTVVTLTGYGHGEDMGKLSVGIFLVGDRLEQIKHVDSSEVYYAHGRVSSIDGRFGIATGTSYGKNYIMLSTVAINDGSTNPHQGSMEINVTGGHSSLTDGFNVNVGDKVFIDGLYVGDFYSLDTYNKRANVIKLQSFATDFSMSNGSLYYKNVLFTPNTPIGGVLTFEP